ncbi:MAG: hypothetical protein VX938_05295, partial [Myxococcota bacterium]|nr:hypothetical protein [Myxococcota bacterium]
ELIATLHGDNDCVKGNMLAALGNVRVSHLLDHDLWERCGLTHPQGRDDILDALGDAADGGSGDTPPPRMEGRAELSSLRISSRDAR